MLNPERIEKPVAPGNEAGDGITSASQALSNPSIRETFNRQKSAGSLQEHGFPDASFLRTGDQSANLRSAAPQGGEPGGEGRQTGRLVDAAQAGRLSLDAKTASQFSEGKLDITKKDLDDLRTNGKLDFTGKGDPNETPDERQRGSREAQQIEELRRSWDTPTAKSIQTPGGCLYRS